MNYIEIVSDGNNPGVEQLAHALIHSKDKKPAQVTFVVRHTPSAQLQLVPCNPEQHQQQRYSLHFRVTGLHVYEGEEMGQFMIEGYSFDQKGLPQAKLHGFYDAIKKSGQLQRKPQATDL